MELCQKLLFLGINSHGEDLGLEEAAQNRSDFVRKTLLRERVLLDKINRDRWNSVINEDISGVDRAHYNAERTSFSLTYNHRKEN